MTDTTPPTRDPGLGRDEWVAQHEGRVRRDFGAVLGEAIERVPFTVRLLIIAVIGGSLPLFTDNNYVLRIAGTVALFAALALGLNLVAGFAGLLDLGYVAFYGIGGYTYAYLSSDFAGIHLPSWASVALVAGVAVLAGWILGLPSMRLTGDYLAIATLGFLLVFIQLSTSLTRIDLPWTDGPVNLTGGPNGIVNLDDLSLFGFTASTVPHYLYVMLGLLLMVMIVVTNVDRSRIGRGWRALRETELAAETMGMPTKRLKLLAFVFGSTIAGVSGAFFAAWQGAVFPSNFALPVLITLYSIIVLGGLGSVSGVVVGSLVLVVVPELLRDVALASTLFYGAVVLTIFAVVRPRWQGAAVLGGIVALGGVIRLVFTDWAVPSGEGLGAVVAPLLAVPADMPVVAGNVAFATVLVLMFVSVYLRSRTAKLIVAVPALWLLALAWQIRMSQEPSVTRLLLIGAILVALMNFRPAGLFGRTRIEVL